MAMRLHRHGFLDHQALSDEAAGGFGEVIDTQVTNLTRLVDSTLEKVQGIHDDRGLNKQGTADRLFQLGVETRKKLSTMAERGRIELDKALGEAEKELPELTYPPGGSELFRLQRSIEYSEARRMLAELEKAERLAEVRLAAEQGEPDLLLALQLAPKWVRDRLIDPDELEKAKARLMEVTQPKAYAKVATIREALSTYESNVATARQLIAKATGTPVRDEVLEAVTP